MSKEVAFLLQMGDNALILGHRLSEWCGHAPVLEEDIAMANTALDLIGHARLWLDLAGQVEGNGRSADDLAYHRDARAFRNALLVEQPNGDFAHTLMRQCLFDCYHLVILEQLAEATDTRMAEIAAKAVKEVRYHQERSADLVIRLGDGSEESHARMQAALAALWRYVAELSTPGDAEVAMLPDPDALAPAWDALVLPVLAEATLQVPDERPRVLGGKSGRMHSEHLGHLLAVMQVLPRSYPDAVW